MAKSQAAKSNVVNAQAWAAKIRGAQRAGAGVVLGTFSAAVFGSVLGAVIQNKLVCAFLSFCLVSGFLVGHAEAAVRLNPQTVVDLSLSKGLRARGAELQAQRSYLALEQARGVFDFQLSLAPSYEHSEAQTLGGFSNPIDKTFNFRSSLSKKLPTGTTLSLEYQDLRQSSVLSSFSSSNRAPDANLNYLSFGVRQALLSNAFGYADRLGVEIAQSSIESALEGREEILEEVLLNSMTLFWNAFIAERQLKENMAARDKYEQLVRNVRRKAGFNLSTPGELPRLEAEFEGAEQRVKSSSAAYLNALDALKTAVRIDPKEEVILEIPQDLPPLPRLQTKEIGDLRAMRVKRASLANSQRQKSILLSSGRPRLDLVARAATTGVDERPASAFAEMSSGTQPTYFIGLEFQTVLGSSLVRGTLADAEVSVMQAENELRMQEEALRDQLTGLERLVSSQFTLARSAAETVALRERVVRELEVSYRQGRQPLIELIRAYNELFAAQLEKARSIGQYHISLNQLAAARDELVTGAK